MSRVTPPQQSKARGPRATKALPEFSDAMSDDESVTNPFRRLSRTRTKGRADMPDVLTPDEVTRLKELAAALNPGTYGEVLVAEIETAATSAIRPGEAWAADWTRLDLTTGRLDVDQAVKKNGTLGTPKGGKSRTVVIAPSALALIAGLPRRSHFIFATKTGRRMTQSNWTTYWHPIRDAFAAELPADHWLSIRTAKQTALRDAEPNDDKRARIKTGKLDFYELKHRAITFMGTPKPDGLGLASADIAIQVGHKDGALIEAVYMHRNNDLALNRVSGAMGYPAR